MKQPTEISVAREPLTRRSFVAGTAVMPLVLGGLSVQGEKENVAEDTVFELRQYTLYGGKRDTLISLFEEHFIETQDVVGAHVRGTFCDLDDADRFVWLRSFHDMQARPQALENFYSHSPAWLAYKKEANATMVDSDNVLLLRPASSPLQLQSSAPKSSISPGMYGVTIYYLGGVDELQFAEFFAHALLPRLNASAAHPIAILTTAEERNNFPRLPVRERDRIFLWISRWANEQEYAAFAAQMRTWSGWRDKAPEAVLPALMRKPEQLRLKPTSRSPMQ